MPARAEARTPPEGLVTLAFVDVEESTQLLHALGARFAAVLTRLRELVRDELDLHGGAEVDWAGDGAFVAFGSAAEAVEAAAGLQRAVASESWPDGATVRLRVGLHSGAPRLTEEGGYVGIDVHLAARISAAAHGGQVLLSRATRDLARREAGDRHELRPLGDFRLKGFSEREQLYQLVVAGLPDAFPPLHALGGATLPALHHRLVGRAAELGEIQAILARPDVRLVTVTGPGGAGKSRLALEVAAELAAARPVHLVGLASIGDPALIPAAIARALGLRETGATPLAEAVAAELAGSEALLVLDNLEHLPGAVFEISRLIDQAAGLDVLATSRAALRLGGEHVVRVGPLSTTDATTLFRELAAKQGLSLPPRSDEDVREICRRLDGLPLAIELVTARLAVFPPRELLRQLDRGLALTMTGPLDLPDRQRSLAATIAWSYGLLTADERRLHQELAVFAGGCNLEDAAAVTGSDPDELSETLEVLVASGLVRSEADETGAARISMLETVREYAAAQLADAGLLEGVRERHAERFLSVAERSEEPLAGPDQADVMEWLEREHDNLRVALDWALSTGHAEDALRATSALGRFWRARGHVGEARALLRAGLAGGETVSDDVRARALWTEAHQAMAQSDLNAARPALEESLDVFRRLGDVRMVVFTLCELGLVAVRSGDLDAAETLAREALACSEAGADGRAWSAALNTLGIVMDERGAFHEARDLYANALALRRELGSPLLVVNSINNLAFATLRSGDRPAAEEAFLECLALAEELGDAVHRGSALCALGELALAAGATGRASALLRDALAVYDELGDDRMRAECLHALGGVAAAEDRAVDAARLWGAADALRERLGAELADGELEVDERFAGAVAASLGDAAVRVRREGRSARPGDLLHAMQDGTPPRPALDAAARDLPPSGMQR